ncbi:MAG: lectin like domain-containing protein [Methanomicrobiales archaeon]
MKIRATLSLFLITILLAGFSCAFTASAAPALPVMVKADYTCIAPFSSAYNNWLHTRSAEPYENQGGHGLGLIPAPVDLSGASDSANWGNSINGPEVVGYVLQRSAGSVQPTGTLVVAAASSDRYDLRTLGKLSPIRNQGQDGNCWAFASIGSLESSLLPGERYDFSENNEKNLHGFGVPINLGGNDFMATAYLTRWSGPVSETADPYSYGNSISPSGAPVEKHVQEVFFIPTRREPLDNDLIKSAVRQYGAVYSTLRYEASSYSQRTASYYYSGSGGFNHAIDIVGWDDGYSSGNFDNPPPGNGAFIARNSWGSTWGDAGYFYISYYDTRIGRDNAMFTAESPNNYSRVYQYDPLGWVANFGFGSDTAYYANVFTSVGNEQLKAVGFYTSATNTEYEVKVFLNPDTGPVSSSGYVSEQNGTISLPGYHTIRLDNQVSLKKGDRFSVAVKVVSAGWTTPVAIELPIDGYSSEATASSGQSFISSNGAGWSDLTLSQPNTNVCLKAFTNSGSTSVTATKPTSTGWQYLKNLTRPPISVKSSVARIYPNTGSVNQTNLATRTLIAQASTRNATQSFVPAPVSYVSNYRINLGNVSTTASFAEKIPAMYHAAG